MRRKNRRKGMKAYCMDKGKPLFCNSYYAGVVKKHTDCVDIRNEKGLHIPLITPAFKYNLLRRMQKNKTKYNKFVGIRQGNRAKSNPNAKFYDEYRCRGCNKYIDSDEVHEAIKELIKGLERVKAGEKTFIVCD